MLLYHMFLMQGGFRHYMTFERNIPKWKENVKDLPKVSVLIPAHNEEVVIRQTLKAMVNLLSEGPAGDYCRQRQFIRPDG